MFRNKCFKFKNCETSALYALLCRSGKPQERQPEKGVNILRELRIKIFAKKNLMEDDLLLIISKRRQIMVFVKKSNCSLLIKKCNKSRTDSMF